MSHFTNRSHFQVYVTSKIRIKGHLFLLSKTTRTMSSTSSTAGSHGAFASQQAQQSHRPLRREGAIIFPSAAEQALMDAMERSSPPPEPLLGKRTHDGQDNEQEAGDTTEPDEGGSTTDSTRAQEPSFGNITVATLRYASHKKLRSEQRDEVEAFLQVSIFIYIFEYCVSKSPRIPHWVVKLSYSYVSCPSRTKSMRFDLPRHLTKYRMS